MSATFLTILTMMSSPMVATRRMRTLRTVLAAAVLSFATQTIALRSPDPSIVRSVRRAESLKSLEVRGGRATRTLPAPPVRYDPFVRLGRSRGGGSAARSASATLDGSKARISRVIHEPENSVADIAFVIEDPQALTPFGRKGPTHSPPTVDEAVRHLCDKVFWFADGRVTTRIVSLQDDDPNLLHQLTNSNVVIALGVSDRIEMLESVWKARSEQATETDALCHFAVNCSAPLPARVGPLNLDGSNAVATIASQLLPWTKVATARRLHLQMGQLLERWTTDDFCSALLLFVNQFISEVDWVKHSIDATWEKGPVRNAAELSSMVSNCGDCIGRCLADENCRECIGKLTQVDSRDQVASYKTIVSYESDLLRDFSLCILTKNNIFQCDATIPSLPVVAPMRSWRSKPLTEDVARSLLVGHLADPAAPEGSLKLPVSWKVACGANVAYDQFPSQNQLFYPAARGRDMWYDPVFRVQTLDGRNVWCKRHYKVRPAAQPGTFRLSVLDNGVTSNEFWTIVGAADDLSWIVFHYAGAASAVGQRYLGGLLCTPDGSLPPDRDLPEIWMLFQGAGIQPWELYKVDNDDDSPGAVDAGPPPLTFYRDEVRAKRAASQQALAG